MSSISAVIVEDSRLARNELKQLLLEHPNIDVIAEAEHAEQALAYINELKPALIFLDINMPGKNGFELLEALDHVPIVIFTTAYDEYAIKSFEFNALDYLLKPISQVRFNQAMQKVAKQYQADNELINRGLNRGLQAKQQIFIKDGERCWLVKLTDIFLLEIEGNYTRVYFKDEKAFVHKSLNQIEENLPDTVFFRANRQQIINVEHIQKITPWFSGNLMAELPQGLKIEISRRQASLFKDWLSL